MPYTPPVLPDVTGGTFAVPGGAPGPHSKLHSDERDAIVAAGTELAAHETDATHLHIRVSESSPVVHVAPDGDDTFDGRWDRPLATVYAGIRAAAAARGRLQFSPGTHTIAAADAIDTEVDASGLVVQGAGTGKTIIRAAGAFEIIKFNGSASKRHSDMVFRDFTLEGRPDGVTRTATAGFFHRWGERARYERVETRYMNGPGWVGESAVGSRAAAEFHQFWSHHNADSGIKADKATLDGNMVVLGGLLNDNDTYGYETNSTTQSLVRVWIPNNHLFGARMAGNGGSLFKCLLENNCVGGNPTTWAASTTYVAGQRVLANANPTTVANDCFMVTVGGTTTSTEPTWTSAPNMGDTVTQNGVTYWNVGSMGNNHIGAGIDDTGAHRLHVVAPDSLYQGPMFLGDTIYEYPESDVGGSWTRLNGFSGSSSPHTRPGLRFYGDNTVGAIILARDDRQADVGIQLRPKGSGKILGGTATQLYPRLVERGGTIPAPTGAADYVVWRAPYACTVTAVKGYRNGGTGATVNAVVRHSGSNVDLLASDKSLTSADTWTDGGSVQNTAVAAGDALIISLRSVSGTVTSVGIQVELSVP